MEEAKTLQFLKHLKIQSNSEVIGSLSNIQDKAHNIKLGVIINRVMPVHN